MKKINNFIIYVIVFFIVLTSFIVPNILFRINDYNFQVAICKNEQDNTKIDVSIGDIYLVNAIHNIEKTAVVEVTSEGTNKEIKENDIVDKNIGISIENELSKLKEYEIISEFAVTDSSKKMLKMVKKTYQNKNMNYNINAVSFNVVNYYNYQMEIEDKTGKILNIMIDKNNLNTSIEKERIMRNFISYLDLDIIDDWKYENKMLISEKAKLVVNLISSEKKCLLSIYSKNKDVSNIEYVYIDTN